MQSVPKRTGQNRNGTNRTETNHSYPAEPDPIIRLPVPAGRGPFSYTALPYSRLNGCQRVLYELLRGPIDTRQAWHGPAAVQRLGARIYDLRKQGYNITTTLVEGHNRYGKTVRYAVYSLHTVPNRSVPVRTGTIH